MERKKLKFMDVNEEDVLDREQMRNIMAGSGCGSGGSPEWPGYKCCNNDKSDCSAVQCYQLQCSYNNACTGSRPKCVEVDNC